MFKRSVRRLTVGIVLATGSLCGIVYAAHEQSTAPLTLDERDQAALHAIEAKVEPLRSALADIAMQSALLEAKRDEVIKEIQAQQQEAQRVITEGARALGVDEKTKYSFDIKTMTITPTE